MTAMNILEVEDLIKGLPDDALMQEAQQPSGQYGYVPQFLLISEIQRRTDMRDRYQAQLPQEQRTVADQIIQEAMAPQGAPGMGLPPMNGGPPPMPSQMPPPPQMAGGPPQMPPGMPPQMPPGMPPMPPGMPPGMPMAHGGAVPMRSNGGVPDAMIGQAIRQVPNAFIEDSNKFNKAALADISPSDIPALTAMTQTIDMGIPRVLSMARGGVVGESGYRDYSGRKDYREAGTTREKIDAALGMGASMDDIEKIYGRRKLISLGYRLGPESSIVNLPTVVGGMIQDNGTEADQGQLDEYGQMFARFGGDKFGGLPNQSQLTPAQLEHQWLMTLSNFGIGEDSAERHDAWLDTLTPAQRMNWRDGNGEVDVSGGGNGSGQGTSTVSSTAHYPDDWSQGPQEYAVDPNRLNALMALLDRGEDDETEQDDVQKYIKELEGLTQEKITQPDYAEFLKTSEENADRRAIRAAMIQFGRGIAGGSVAEGLGMAGEAMLDVEGEYESLRQAIELAKLRGAPEAEAKQLQRKFDTVKIKLEAALEMREGTAPSRERETKIAALIRLHGLSEKDATDLVDGNVEIRINSQTGETQLIDKVSRKTKIIPNTRDNVSVVSPKEGETLADMAPWATGWKSSLVSALAVPMAWVTFGTFKGADKTVFARNQMEFHSRQLIRALSVNPRFPVAEMNAIKEEINIYPKLWDDPSLLLIRMASVKRGLTLRLQQEQSVASDPRTTVKDRTDASAAIIDISNYLAILGDPENQVMKMQADDDAGKPPESFIEEGNDPAVWPFISEEYRKEWKERELSDDSEYQAWKAYQMTLQGGS